jgi:hypothetical protein
MIQTTRLAEIVDAVNEAAFFGRTIPLAERNAVAGFIAGRHCVVGTYARMFGLFPEEQSEGIRLFTGERITNAAARHIAGEEACRALLLLKANSPAARKALAEATQDMIQRLGPADAQGPKPEDGQQHWLWPYRGGTYCCGACSAGLWRHLTAGGLDDAERRLARGLKCLRACRKGDGTWRVFPYWYTLSALIEMQCDEVTQELRYAAGKCEGAAKRKSSEKYALRRAELARRVMARV